VRVGDAGVGRAVVGVAALIGLDVAAFGLLAAGIGESLGPKPPQARVLTGMCILS
jgi:hypothetical protein